jgi:hypothetical protein
MKLIISITIVLSLMVLAKTTSNKTVDKSVNSYLTKQKPQTINMWTYKN